MFARAVEIADLAMTGIIQGRGIDLDPESNPGIRYGLTDADGTEVATIEEADPMIVEAFAWLNERGLARPGADDVGQYIELTGSADPENEPTDAREGEAAPLETVAGATQER
jgi:hypothetical protein